MLPWKACEIGDPVEAIDTPALLLDLNAFERNLQRMAQAAGHMRLRPHAKSHKCPEIALQQVKHGAVGICCQKLSEAFVFAEAGIKDILVTNQIVGARKLCQVRKLAEQINLGVLVDHISHVRDLAHVMQGSLRELDVYVELDVGAGRCGASCEQAVELARAIHASDGLRFAGIHAYHGAAQHFRTAEQRALAIQFASHRAAQVKAEIEAVGMQVPVITGAGTGTFCIERDSGVYQEIQPGSYIFMDKDYAANELGVKDVKFEHALFVATRVQSRPSPAVAVVDAGLKASSVDSGMPCVWGRDDLVYVKASDEHGVIQVERTGTDNNAPGIGDLLMLVPGHCDPTVNLYDEIICVRHGRVEAIWQVSARGCCL